jgi:hypothetical protein
MNAAIARSGELLSEMDCRQQRLDQAFRQDAGGS